MTIGPDRSLVVKNPVDGVRLWVDRQIVKANVSMDQDQIGLLDADLRVGVHHRLRTRDQPRSVDNARQAIANPFA